MVLLQPQEHLTALPQFFQPVIAALVRRKQVHHHVAKINNQPATAGLTIDFSFDLKRLADIFYYRVAQAVQHTVAGS